MLSRLVLDRRGAGGTPKAELHGNLLPALVCGRLRSRRGAEPQWTARPRPRRGGDGRTLHRLALRRNGRESEGRGGTMPRTSAFPPCDD
ncbi:MAG: hypothetical protein QOJ59_4051 [Thermomicrobiales bacterium]|nr:hypothetical protein [Thermomicrobiales bacterium]